MNLKMRPISEAPLGEDILVQYGDGTFSVMELGANRRTSATGFYRIPDLLRAAEILAQITPDGYEFESTGITRDHTDDEMIKSVRVYFRRIPPPVGYEYVTDGKPRWPLPGDYVVCESGEWTEVKSYDQRTCRLKVQLCYRRVEVKR